MRERSESRHMSGGGAAVRKRLLWSFTVLAAGAVAAAPAQGKTYFTVTLGVEGPFETGVDCLQFTATEVCTSSGLCGPWERTEPVGPETGFSLEFSYEEQGARVEIDGDGRINNRGPQDSAGGAKLWNKGSESSAHSLTPVLDTHRRLSDMLE